MDIDSKYIVTIKGKKAVLYKGLLNLIHEKDLKSIESFLIQAPNKENGMLAVCKARVTLKDGTFSEDIGDASPENVNTMVSGHITRMSNTRAKARAMRDLLNIDLVAVEELADDIEFESTETKTTADPLGDPLAETIKDPFVKKGREDNVARKQKEKVDTDDFFGDTTTPVKSNDIDLDIPTDKFDDTILDEL